MYPLNYLQYPMVICSVCLSVCFSIFNFLPRFFQGVWSPFGEVMKIPNVPMPTWVSETPLGPQNSIAAVGGLVTLLTCMCIGILVRRRRRGSISSNIQRYQWNTGVAGTPKKRWMWDSLQLLREGYSKVSPDAHIHTDNLALSNDWWPQFYGRPWQVWTSEGYQLVLPPAYLDELKMLPDHTLPSSLREVSLPNHSSARARPCLPRYPGIQC